VFWTLNDGVLLVVFWTWIAFDSLGMLLIEIFVDSLMSWTLTVSDSQVRFETWTFVC
jgi:hypothetical protein